MSLQGAEVHPSEALPEAALGGLGTGETCHVLSFPFTEESDAEEQRRSRCPWLPGSMETQETEVGRPQPV